LEIILVEWEIMIARATYKNNFGNQEEIDKIFNTLKTSTFHTPAMLKLKNQPFYGVSVTAIPGIDF